MAAKFTSSSSTVREKIAALKEQKRLVREIEAKLALQAEQNAINKKALSDHRIATKLAGINGTEPPPPMEPVAVVEPEPVVEPTIDPEPIKPAPKKTRAKKTPPKKAPRKKRSDS
jgi:hypothetical protein|tara:strand:+ start:243 stop:587 length:345 start_codon:yes stop_codon:yes gene_type:complete